MKKKFFGVFFGAARGVYIFNGGADISIYSASTLDHIEENTLGNVFFAQTSQGVRV